MWPDPSRIDLSLDARSVTFENPAGARGAGGTSFGGRKGAPSVGLRPGTRVTLADLTGPGTIRHFWCTVPPAPPEVMRALVLEVFYDGNDEPSISVPLPDFFGAALGRPVAYSSLLTVIAEGRGFNAYFPMPFRKHVRIELHNHSTRYVECYYQIDYTLEPSIAEDAGALHATFRRENPTELRRDFVIADGLRGPGRFLGCVVGIRIIDPGRWYGEGEVKVFRDGDTELPTICGTGLEDYVGSAWTMGPHHGPYAGAPLAVRAPRDSMEAISNPEYVGFYRWHVPDPIVFAEHLRVTIQQIGSDWFATGAEGEADAFFGEHEVAGRGVLRGVLPGIAAIGLFERVDDYCATAFVYCRDVQAVPRVDVAAATADLSRRSYERGDAMESFFGS
jgi:hypothetical protein